MLICFVFRLRSCFFFFFNDPATTEIYTLSLHDALPISCKSCCWPTDWMSASAAAFEADRKSTRLNSSHVKISYAVFCLKKKQKKNTAFSRKKTKTKRQRSSYKR